MLFLACKERLQLTVFLTLATPEKHLPTCLVLAKCKSPAAGEGRASWRGYFCPINYTTMKSLLHLLLTTLLFAAPIMAEARPGSLFGRVVDETGKPVVFASALLLREGDSSLTLTELTDEKGEYRLTPPADGRYRVKVVMAGYAAYTSPVVAVAGQMAQPDIVLQPNTAQLQEVAVRAQKQFVEVHADKLVVNVENSIVNAGGSALDVLSHSPGVTIDNNDNISLKGKQGVNVMINGKIQPMSAADLANMLKSMPANAVETIELISNPSAKYDAEGAGGIINLKLKKNKKAGLNGSINAAYAQGVYGKTNGGFNLNYRNNKWNIYTSYNHSYREGFNHLTLQRDFFTNGVFSSAYRQDNNYLYFVTSDMGNVGADYALSGKTTVGIVASADATLFKRTALNRSDVLDSATRLPASRFTTTSQSPSLWSNYALNLNLRHNFDSAGRMLTVDADYAAYPSGGPQDFKAEFYDAAGAPSGRLPEVLHGDQAGLTDIKSIKADYTHPMGKTAKLEAGLKMSYVTADNDLKFYNVVAGRYLPDPGKTYHFVYTEQINAAYMNYSREWDKWSAQIGLRVEQTIVHGNDKTADSTFDRNYMQPFPSFSVQRRLNANNDLGITLSRRIERPNYEQMNPSKFYLDPTFYKAGYPFLNPALSYSAELSHTYKQRLITTINYTKTSAPLTEVLQPSLTESKVTIQTTKNLTTMDYIGVSGAYQFSFYKWWNNTTNLNIYYGHYTGDIAGANLNSGRVTYDLNMTNSFVLPRNWSAELGGNYQAPQVYGYMNLRPNWMLNIGVQKNLFDKRATLKLSITDLFWKGYPSATSYYNNYTETFVSKRDTRQVSLSATWRFGQRAGAGQKHSGGADEERRRAGQSN